MLLFSFDFGEQASLSCYCSYSEQLINKIILYSIEIFRGNWRKNRNGVCLIYKYLDKEKRNDFTTAAVNILYYSKLNIRLFELSKLFPQLFPIVEYAPIRIRNVYSLLLHGILCMH